MRAGGASAVRGSWASSGATCCHSVEDCRRCPRTISQTPDIAQSPDQLVRGLLVADDPAEHGAQVRLLAVEPAHVLVLRAVLRAGGVQDADQVSLEAAERLAGVGELRGGEVRRIGSSSRNARSPSGRAAGLTML